jgi:ABC-2 type transport system ATP-binding protein
MVALSGPSAAAAANPGRATATTSSDTEPGKAGSTENSDKHAAAKHNKHGHKKPHEAKQHKKSSGRSADKKSERQSKKDAQAAAAKQDAQDEAAAQVKATAAQQAATSPAASYSKARWLAVAKATAAKTAAAKTAAAKKAAAKTAAAKKAAAKKAKQVAAQNPIVATTMSTVSEPNSVVPFVPAVISIPQANGTNKSAKAVTPRTKARQTPQHSKVAAEPPRRLAQAVGLGDGLQPLLVTAFVLVFGFGLVVGGTTRRVASRTR